MALNLKKSSLQRIYEYALRHVRKQGAKAMNGLGGCEYQTEDDKQCAVGAMLTDEQRQQALDQGIGSVGISRAFFRPIVGTDRTGKKLSLLQALQNAHDSAPMPFLVHFEENMQNVAADFGLHYEPAGGKSLRT